MTYQIEPEASQDLASERGRAASAGEISLIPANAAHPSKCPQCSTPYVKKRKHQIFCSSRCRKLFWLKERTVQPGRNVWQKLDVILAKIDRIERHLGIKEGGS